MPDLPAVGTIAWTDLTVPDAPAVREFYRAVVGWGTSEVDMGGYADFNMQLPGNGQTVAGICHARGMNAEIPAAWMIYIIVADLDASLAAATSGGGAIVSGPREMTGAGRYAIIRDPAGAVAALFQSTAPSSGTDAQETR